ncbi:uncharacterized protein LOC126629097 [Malus sylvestris]|uniref:uncharacterized protein LOC126629097 n=1 Tax=Malus sylvestris TaxID=3752 RepID=UPI0021ACFCCB|nr:uncharacterized protein LOC126629097 [Malus sylvestris]
MGGVSLKGEDEAFCTKSKDSFKQCADGGSKRNGDKEKGHQEGGSSRPWGAPKYHSNRGQSQNNKRFEGKCYNCGKKGHMVKKCWFKKSTESNVASAKEKIEDDWDAVAYLAMEEKWDDEASSWWCSENEVLADSREVEDTLQEKMGDQSVQIQSSLDELKDLLDGDDVKQEVLESPWQTGVCQQPEEDRHSEVEVLTPRSQLRRSTGIPKPNPKYANATIVKEAVEAAMHKEASENSEWREARRRGRCIKEMSNLRSSGKAKRCETHIMQMGVQDKASTH